jgi:gliding motility-associated-like protein
MHTLKSLISFSLGIVLNCLAQNPCGNMDLLSVNDTSICNEQTLVIFANNGFENYAWNTGENTQGITINTPGTYTVSSSFNTNNLVINGNFTNGTSGFTSSYNYNQFSLWNAGTYSVTANAGNVHPNFVGTGNGNFLVVNGSQSSGSQVWCQDIEVTQNTDYNFSTSVNTVATGNPAQLQFSINGSVIGTEFIAPNNLNNWDDFNATWNSGTTTNAEICVVNQNISGSGNDFGLDDITFTTLCSASESIVVTMGNQANATIFTENVLCESGPLVDLNAVDQNGIWSGNGIVNTSTGLFSPSLAGPGSHLITYNINTSCGAIDTIFIEVVEELETEIIALNELCANENYLNLEGLPGPGLWLGNGISNSNIGVFDPMLAVIGENTISYSPSLFCASTASHTIEVYDVALPQTETYYEICYGQWIELELDEEGFDSFLWSTNATSNSILVNSSGDYLLEFSDENSCEQEITFTVLDKDSCELITMPNVFSPNNDLINDVFRPIDYEYVSSSTLKIFNRWGGLVWSTDNVIEGWNGKHFDTECLEGIYTWLVEFKTNKDVYKTKSGTVNLYR